jgi:two-component system cell cycle sensor histidine kinase/response regulator CckA
VQPGEYTVLAVADTGLGMDESTKARIFDPFFTTKEPGKGTGLGLPVVYGIVKQSGGCIDVETQPGQGTTFKIYLPHARERIESAISFEHERSMPSGHETLLLVEDDDAVRALARHVLQRCGYTVREATNGRDAIQLVETYGGPLDLVVSDVVMPHIGGRELAERLTALRPGLRVLFLSGYADDEAVRHGVFQSDVAFLQKPFTTARLAQKVRELLDARRKRTGPTTDWP